jgi:hypothetical protein
MINWIYTWHNPRVDAGAKQLSEHMGDIFLCGLLSQGNGKRQKRAKS